MSGSGCSGGDGSLGRRKVLKGVAAEELARSSAPTSDCGCLCGSWWGGDCIGGTAGAEVKPSSIQVKVI